ncbi:hypothetical protein CHRY9393_01193 [Chryseobacterium fistulae]|uniref:Uncharacterized protein n=1 Tax=Chryseobacterium fistulae TaxID=2675058 RepID=A0A6N4XT08_9FLAO|nr:hypothetical protein CHRY9393_01193 [Chryseobacterium fistulae]
MFKACYFCIILLTLSVNYFLTHSYNYEGYKGI